MKQIMNNQTQIFNDDNKDGRFFDYVMNSKRAKIKLLKGAQRPKSLEVEVKDGCAILLFSDGSYYKIVLPLLRIWHQNVNQTISINDNEVRIDKIDQGFEDSQKHMDTKLVIVVNNCRLVLHAYNSSQKLMIQGKHSENFAVNCLIPFFTKKIEEDIEQINRFNDKIKDTLGTKKLLKKAGNSVKCPQCEVTSSSNGELKVHMKTCHTKPGIGSPQRNKIPKILVEDISILDDDDDDDIKTIEMEEALKTNEIEEEEKEETNTDE